MQVCHFQHLLRQFDKNEPGRFLGEGVSFRAKLIGVLEVPEARGDRMCQEALADLKMAIRAAGEHKQRIQVHVAIDGLRLRDDKTGDSLYHHPVHKISFIAQDMTDSRAFGYIFGSPDTGHRFFGIKTDKAASQVVIAMRDLFQVVFELKKKEIEMAKQQLEGKSVTSSLVRHTAGVSSETKSKVLSSVGESSTSSGKPSESAEGGVAELVDLEQELSSLRRGLTQVEGLTPSADPFGDSFIVTPAQSTTKTLLPPPPSGSSTRGRNTPAAPAPAPGRAVFSPSKPALPFDLATVAADFEPVVPAPAPALADAAEATELKNPPKKVLKDLVPPQGGSLLTDILQEPDYGAATTMTSLSRQSGGSVSISKQSSMYSGGFFTSDPFADADPFDSADPFSDSFKDDPFAQEFPKARTEEKKTELAAEPVGVSGMKSVFNGPLQVSLPPEPAPKSPRLQRQTTDTSSIRQRPTPSSKLNSESASPPPPLPPKKTVEVSVGRPPPRPPTEHEDSGAESGPPLPPPARKKEPLADRTTKPRLSSLATNSSSDEYLAVAPPPLPAPRRFDITLSQLLTCSQQQLAERLRVPEKTLSSMTLPQLTAYLRSYLASDVDKAHIHVESAPNPNSYRKIDSSAPASLPSKPPTARQDTFEDNFTASTTNEVSDTFVANFDDFDKKANSSYDRYAAFREIQEQELKTKSLLDPSEDEKQNGDADKAEDEEEMTSLNELVTAREEIETELKENKGTSPMKSLEELTLDSFNMFRNSVSPKPSKIESKIEDIKNVMKHLQIEQSRRSVSPRDNGRTSAEPKIENPNDRYAALREITITSPPPDDFESLPSEAPKERKRSDEKSDGFDNSDFFDCIDNNSLSFSHVDDAFRKSPVVPKEVEKEKDREERVMVEVTPQKESVRDVREVVIREPVRELQPPPRLSTGSMSDVASGSSPDTKDMTRREAETAGRWSVLAAPASPWSSDSRDSECAAWRSPPPAPAPRPRRRPRKQRQTSSSSRDVSPWEEEPPAPRHHRAAPRESRHNSSQGSRECLDSGSGRDKDKIRDKRERERDLSRDGRDSVSTRESMRDRRDSGSGRDRALSKDSHRDRRDRRSRDREPGWDRDRDYRDRDYRDTRSRDSRSRERLPKDYREQRPRKHHSQSWDDEEDYSDGCGSGRSSPRERWPDQRWRRDERHYGSLGYRDSKRRIEMRQTEDTERRYGATLAWASRRAAPAAPPRRDADRRRRRDEPPRHHRRDQRFPADFPPRDRAPASPFDNDFVDTPAPPPGKKRGNYASLEGTRFAFEQEDTASPLSASSARARDGDSAGTRFRFDSDSVSPRSMFEDDFTAMSTPRARAASIAEEDEGDLPPLRAKPAAAQKDLKKSESVNIFVRDSDPFAGDDFFACTGSDRAARRENWPGDFQAFDNV